MSPAVAEHHQRLAEKTFNAGPVQLNYAEGEPNGPPLVLLHGLGRRWQVFLPLIPSLGLRWHIFAPDLRGHGKSTGRRIYFGVHEARDLSQLLDELVRDGQLAQPVGAVGESYGAALALRWKTVEPRVDRVVAIAPYAELSNAVLNICHEYAGCLPQAFVKSPMFTAPASNCCGFCLARLRVTKVKSRRCSGRPRWARPFTSVQALLRTAVMTLN